ncbi:alpha-L-Rha alpha-1,3-L-rhamnosyltransferase [Bosea sp. BIWAKO-01]|nr:alpha-L-Rha alpha-1,3-L-rhamnosyltransferase [Bosea sp. BIWAKO-01]
MPVECKSVSVVMATYNGAKYVEEQLQSIIGQTFRPLEIIVSDDASSDATLEIVERLAAGCGIETKILRNAKPLGFRDNFLRASLIARGDFIAFCDQDDVWDAEKLEKCSKFFADPSISMIVHTAITVDRNANKIGDFRQGIRRSGIRQPLSYDPWLTFFGFSIVYRRELLRVADINDRFIDYIVPTEMIAHDRWIMFLAQMVGSTAELAEPLVKYRQHESNTFGSRSKNRKRFDRDIRRDTDFYIASTAKMLEIVCNIPEEVGYEFPLFDRDKSKLYLERALNQLTMRRYIYNSQSKISSFGKIYRCVKTGSYRSVHGGHNRWRSLGRDLQFALLGR